MLTLIEPVAIAVHLQDMDVMGEPVEQLAEQLGAVARLAVGDTEALERIAGTAALTDQRG